MKIVCVAGARPNFMKIAPVMAALEHAAPPFEVVLIHTGQHYDKEMSERHFTDLGIRAPDLCLDVGSGSHALQTAEVMKRFEPVLDRGPVALVLVVGDVNSTLACALVAAKKGIRVAHVEAGLRSFDRAMPEEVNRVLTDQISDFLFTTERGAAANLAREGIDPSRVHFVGNVMIDSLRRNLARAVVPSALPGSYAVLTLHRPSNVDEEGVLRRLLETMRTVGAQLPVRFLVHPRTRTAIDRFGLAYLLAAPQVVALPPLGYLEMLGLMRDARVVLTDSGGMQEETTALGVPCITLRDTTERPVTVEEGTNVVVGRDSERILAVVREVLAGGGKAGRVPELWDGHAAERIAAVLHARLRAECAAKAA